MTMPMPAQLWLPDPQMYAIDQERYRHDGALTFYGEYALFVLMWKLEDHVKGLVERCSVCYVAYGKTTEAYGQSPIKNCENCYGTTFEGGWKAKIVRLSMWDTNETDHVLKAHGEIKRATSTVQTTSDFRLRTGDYIFRGDETRWRMQTVSTNHLRTGFLMPTSVRTPLGYNFGQVVLEDESSVAYLIEPRPEERVDVTIGNDD